MVIAHHLIWTAYGAWLPNDPRGSGSHHVGRPTLAELGPHHLGRKKTQPSRSTVRAFYRLAEPQLLHPVIRFDPVQIACIGAALGEVIERHYTCYACAVMPDHVHLVIRKHKHPAEQMIATLQDASCAALIARRLVPPHHPVWTVGGRKVFLNTPPAVRTRVRYVENNPEKEELSRQPWPFVTGYDGWPHPRTR